MRIPILAALTLFISISLQAQVALTNCNDPIPSGEIHSMVNQSPVFGDCNELVMWDHDKTFSYQCTDKNVLNYLKSQLKTEVAQPVKITAVVERSGCLSGIKIMEDNEDETGIEIKKLVARMPKWKPGMLDGKFVRSRVIILYQPLEFE